MYLMKQFVDLTTFYSNTGYISSNEMEKKNYEDGDKMRILKCDDTI